MSALPSRRRGRSGGDGADEPADPAAAADPPRPLRAPDPAEAHPHPADGAAAGAALPPASLGPWLREHRTALGLGLDEVERETRIGRRYLEAIEGERYELLPAPVYARGFVRGYARCLGLDEEEALALMPRDLPLPPGLDPLPGLRRREGPPAVPALERRWLAIGAVAVLAAAAVFLVRGPGLRDAPGLGAVPFVGGGEANPAAEATVAPPPAELPPFEPGEVPDLRGVERGEAERALRANGFGVLVIELASDTMPAGRVSGQAPAPGDAAGGDEITLIVSSGPDG